MVTHTQNSCSRSMLMAQRHGRSRAYKSSWRSPKKERDHHCGPSPWPPDRNLSSSFDRLEDCCSQSSFNLSTALVTTLSNSSYALSSRDECSEVVISIYAEARDEESSAHAEEVPGRTSEVGARTSRSGNNTRERGRPVYRASARSTCYPQDLNKGVVARSSLKKASSA